MTGTVLVTGMSGAGRTSCLKILEDFGYEAVDNLPIGLLDQLLRIVATEPYRVAVGIDSRTRDFEPDRLVRQIGTLRGEAPDQVSLLFLECDDEVLRRRFSATRRRHPLAERLPVAEALAEERGLMAPLKDAADVIVDTSELAVPDLRRILAGHFARGGAAGLEISVVSFSFREGLPREADLVFDVRFLRNPHYVDELRPLTGAHPEVQAYVRGDPDFEGFVTRLQQLLAPLLPRYEAEGKSYLTVGIGCTGGRHRSVYLAELLAAWLREGGREAAVRHRDLPPPPPGVAAALGGSGA